MRVKQLLITVMLLAALAAVAATSELTNISLVAQGGSTVVTITASGAFHHNEYRPVENVMFVDFPGLSAGKLLDKMKGVQMPGLTGYRVVNYSGANGAQVARVELTLAPGADIKVRDAEGGVTVQISGNVVAKAEPAKPSAAKPAAAPTQAGATTPQPPAKSVIGKPAMPASAAAPSAAGAPSLVRDVNVVRAGDGVQVEISGTAPMQPRTLKLTRPDRIVIDLPNAETTGQKNVSVNSGDVIAVRMGQFQAAPPVTRIVVDLKSPMDFDVAQNGNKVVVNLKASTAAKSAPAAAPKMTPAPAKMNAEQKPEAKPAQKPQQNMAAKVSAPEKPVALPAPAKVAASHGTPVPVKSAAKAVPQPEQELAPSPANTPGGGSKPEDFVMVQPTYTPKPATAAETKTDLSPDRAAQHFAMNTAPQQPTSSAAAAPAPTMVPVNFAAEQRQANAAGQVSGVTIKDRPRYTGEPISVNLKDADIKDFFRLIHEISGLNIVLDPGVNGSLTLVLDDVPWDQALDIVLKNNGLDRQLDGNVLRIATMEGLKREADLRRAQIQAQALAVDKVSITRFLSYAHAKDVLPTVKKMLSARGDVITDDRTNALIIQDIPTVIPDIDKLLATLDRKTQEVEIEARVVAATRNFARDIGTQLGFGFGNSPTAVGGVAAVGTSPIQDAGTSPQIIQDATTKGSIPLFSSLAALSPTSGLQFLNVGSNHRIDAILTMAESRGLLKVLSRPRIVTQNNVQALVRQGLRVPVTTLGQLGGPPTVTYIDAFLRLTVTPQITVENTIFLNIDVENTTADFSRQVQGNPTLITQQATTQVLVTDGGTAVIGGVIQTQNNYTVQQVPLLGDIPVLGNAFKRKSTSTSTQELIFFITPKIIQT